MTKEDAFSELGIRGVNLADVGRQQLVICPKCSPERRKKNSKDLSVRVEPDAILYKCHHCSWEGAVMDDDSPKYVRPQWTNVTQMSDKAVEWFKSRGIGQQTLIDCKVTDGKHFIPQRGKEMNCVMFNYFRADRLINIKYRSGQKDFVQVKGAEKILYGLNDIAGKDEFGIVEGEIDKLSFWEAGVQGICSAPDGAPPVTSVCHKKPVKFDDNGDHVCPECNKKCQVNKANNVSKFNFLDNTYHDWKDAKKIVIAVDDDPPGHALADELSRRFGRHRCYRVQWPKGCKDANDVLKEHGPDRLRECYDEAEPWPVEGVFYVNDLKNRILNLYREGLVKGDVLGFDKINRPPHTQGQGPKPMDELVSWKRGFLCVFTGIPSHGKSIMLEYISLLLAQRHGWRWGVFSPEHYPPELHFARMAKQLVGYPFFNEGADRMPEEMLNRAIEFIGDHYYFVRPDDDSYTPGKVLDIGSELVSKMGISAMIIDPWNRLVHDYGSRNETQYIENTLREMNQWKQKHECGLFIVAHPTKVSKSKDGMFDVPNLYSISGSAHWYNMADFGFTVYRDFKENETRLYVQKVKHEHLGEIGYTTFQYNKRNTRYHQYGQPANMKPLWDGHPSPEDDTVVTASPRFEFDDIKDPFDDEPF